MTKPLRRNLLKDKFLMNVKTRPYILGTGFFMAHFPETDGSFDKYGSEKRPQTSVNDRF